jgi:hypothetical protein
MTLRASPRLTLELAERRIFKDEKFFLVDVGASGGIAAQWYAFGRDLVAVGFDPLVAEVDRLNRANTHSGIRYYSAYVGYGQYDRLFPAGLRGQKVKTRDNQPFPSWIWPLWQSVTKQSEEITSGFSRPLSISSLRKNVLT